MISTSIPAKFLIPWGANANSTYIRSIPTTSQIGIQNGAASLNDGFPPLTFTPESAGGTPPFGQDFNGILNEVTKVQQWQQAGGGWVYDGAFASSIGGYPAGAIVNSAILPGRQWLNTTDSNTQNPDVFPFTGWTALPGCHPPGTPIPSFSSTALSICVLANGTTIGNAGSGGTTAPTGLASATAFFLFCAIWQQFSQSICPTQFNGANIARGANPNADWVAGRVIVLPQMAGASVIGQDAGTTFLNSVPVQSGSTTTPGSIVGENLHTLTLTELAQHLHANTAADGGHIHSTTPGTFTNTPVGGGSTAQPFISTGTAQNSGIGFASITVTNANAGGGGAHNNVDRSFTVAWNLSL